MVRDASNRGMEDEALNYAQTPSGGEGIVDSMQDATKIESATTAQAWRTQEVCTHYAEADEHQYLNKTNKKYPITAQVKRGKQFKRVSAPV